MSVLPIAWLLWTGFLAVPVLIFFLEILLGASGDPAPQGMLGEAPAPRVAVLVPAHDEAAGIALTVLGVKKGLGPQDRLLVVADNCTDDTALLARNAGAEVIERVDRQSRGKSYALDFGVRHLAPAPPDIVVIVDADCDIDAQSLRHISARAFATGRPVQALYLMRAPAELGISGRLAEFAWRVKNHARPLGLLRLGLPCQLMGTGMAFPWNVISRAQLASGHIVEDLQLGLDLARSGTPPLFAPDAHVVSQFAANAEGASSQRTRWEHGHLQTLAARAPEMLWRALRSGNRALLALTLDLLVPPVALLALCVLVTATVSVLLAGMLPGFAPPLHTSIASLLLLVVAISLAWWRFGRDIVSPRDMLRIPLYMLRKLPIYFRFLTARQVKWVRAKRDS
jgi:cellulose synthase/poly-beta-1,6-N-acetylglucosamine synthase-like glycosyltransferase